MQNKSIKHLPKEERPYEKVREYGVHALTNAELLAVLLRSGTKGSSSVELARTILELQNGEQDILNIHQLTFEQLVSIHGIGDVKAIQILCLSELTKRMANATAKKGLSFPLPSTIADYYMEDMRHQSQEQMKLLLLDTKTQLIDCIDVSKGTVNASLISPRELFIEALHRNAVSIILLHNHPSGDPTPSETDIMFTKRVQHSGELLGIELLDHIIIGNNCYKSLAEMKLL